MRTTITFNDKLFRALKLRAVETDTSISDVVEQAVTHQILEDAEDMEDALARKGEATYSFDELLIEFQSEGLL